MDDWITTSEAVSISGYNVQHIRRLARSGEIESRKWARDWMISRKSLQDYLKNKGHGPKPRLDP